MPRNYVFCLCMILIILYSLMILSCSDTVSQSNSDILSGYWEGKIHPDCNYTMILHFYQESDKQVGRYYLFQNNTPIQLSQLQNIDFADGKLSFNISGESTPFEGEIDVSNKLLSGNFYFPGGNAEPVLAKNVTRPSRILPIGQSNNHLNRNNTMRDMYHPR